MAAKGAAFGIRHLLKKVDENFAWAKPRGRVRRQRLKHQLYQQHVAEGASGNRYQHLPPPPVEQYRDPNGQ